MKLKPANRLLLIGRFLKSAIFFAFCFAETPWPLAPVDSVQPLGNNWGNFQNYGGGSYFHNGIDIITPGRQGVPVYAVAHGWVKAWLTTQAGYHWRLAIADSSLAFTDSCEAWLYAHIDPNRFHKNVGDEVNRGDLIGYLAPWPVTGFDHIHFARIKDAGSTWPIADWSFVRNPLTIIRPNTDREPPVFENAVSGQKFAFCRNNTSNYLSPNNLSGDVDIIAKIYDKTGYTTGNNTWDKLAPFKIEYSINREDGSVILPTTTSFLFSNLLSVACTIAVYKRDATCRSRGDYSYRDYFFIVTNTDGDTIIEVSDTSGTWRTRDSPDGNYWVKVTASDVYGNSTSDSMRVTTNNGIVGINRLETTKSSFPLATFFRTNPQFIINQNKGAQINLFDAQGRLIESINSRGDKFATGGQLKAEGVYFLYLKTKNGSRISKVILLK